MSRHTARNAAMQMIFEHISGGQGGEDTLLMVYQELRDEGLKLHDNEPGVEDRAWIETVFTGVLAHLDEIDAAISAASDKWAIDRMARVDLTIMRLAVWEILFEDQVPDNVAVSEALSLAETYSEPDSKRFINGILGAVVRSKPAQPEEA